MRILIIHTRYKAKGGEDSVVANETELLTSAGHQVELLLFSNASGTAAKLAQLPFNINAYIHTKRRIKSFRPEVVHIHNLHFAGSLSVLYAVKQSGIPSIVTLHNYRLLCPSGTLYYNNALFTDSVWQLIPFEAIRLGVYQDSKIITLWVVLAAALHQLAGSWRIPSKFIVLGENQQDIFRESKYRELVPKMTIKPNFCYPATQKRVPKEDYYLFVGRISTEKGIDLLLKSFAITGLPLRVVGSGPQEKKVKEMASLNSNIKFLGTLEKNSIYELLAGARALIFSSLWYETFGMVIIEAFAAGTPVIAAKIGEAKHIVIDGYNGLLFEPGSEEALICQLQCYEALSTGQKEAFETAALKTYEAHYTPEANLKQLENLYHSVIPGNT